MFVFADDGGDGRIDDAIHQQADLFFDGEDVLLCRFQHFRRVARLLIPCVLEHRGRDVEQFPRRLQFTEQGLEFTFHLGAGDGFSTAFAILVVAEVVGKLFRFALCPAGGERPAAIRAQQEAAQREVQRDVFPRRGAGLAVQALLDFLERFEGD